MNEDVWRRNARLKLAHLAIDAGANAGLLRSSIEGANEALYRRRDAERLVQHLERQNLITGGRFKVELDDARVQLEDAETVYALLRQKHDHLSQTPNPVGKLFHSAESIARIIGVSK